jgi:1-acyl-sn-glycerol-3-phosphate acyltransferase
VLALLHLPLRMRFVIRDEIFGWPILGPYLRATEQIEVCPERGAASYRRVVREARAIAAGGESVVIFPQGTVLGIESAFRPGAFALARAIGAPILPVAITGSHRVWEHPYSPRLRYGQRVSLRVLEPLTVGRLDDPYAVCAETERRLKAVALGGAMAPPRRFVPARDGYWDGYAYEIDPAFPELAAEIAGRRARWRAAVRLPSGAP